MQDQKADGDDINAVTMPGSELSGRQQISTFSRSLVKAYKEEAKGRKSTIVFAANLAYVNDLLKAFTDAGINTRAVSSKTNIHKRDSAIRLFREGALPVLVNCKVLIEGCDLPVVSDCWTSIPAA
jgi:ATP-dependent helicase IRC3